MTKEDLRRKFEPIIEERDNRDDIIRLSENSFIKLENFMRRFGDVELKYTEMINQFEDISESWKQRLKKWQENGYIE